MIQKTQPLLNNKYKKIATLGEGSGGKVYLVQKISSPSAFQNENQSNQNIQTQNEQKPNKSYFALKKFKQYNKPPSSSSEHESQIAILSFLNHPNIMKFSEVFTVDKGYKKSTYAVMPYCIQVMDLFKFKEISITQYQLKQIIYQLVLSVQYLHSNQYVHRDIKPSNLLIDTKGVLSLADFDIAVKVKPEMTKNMVTRYYRPPEIIYGSKEYSYEVDIWSLGCSIAEMILEQPIFPGQTDIDQLDKIFSVLGSPLKEWPDAQNYPYFLNFEVDEPQGLQNILAAENQDLLDLIKRMLVLDPKKRISITEIQSHKYFQDVNSDVGQLSKLSEYVRDKKLKQTLQKIEEAKQSSQ